jgi:RsmE family RNA methyltransferase
VNLLLLEPGELKGELVHLEGRRAQHLIDVLEVQPGSSVRVGLLDGPQGTAEVLARHAGSVQLRCQFTEAQSPPPQDVLLLALPRPKVLARCLAHAASLGFGSIAVFRSRRVVKSHFESHVLLPEQVRAQLLAGLEQARRTHVPKVHVFTRFRPFVEDSLASLMSADNRYLADPDAPTALHDASPSTAPFTLVIGPEGGLVPHEVEAFAAAGFRVVHTGVHPLRVESALSFIVGQLTALRNLKAAQR